MIIINILKAVLLADEQSYIGFKLKKYFDYRDIGPGLWYRLTPVAALWLRYS